MTAATARWATDADHPLIEDYACFCHELGITDRALRDRLGQARTFLGQHGDLDAWLARPTRTRLADLQRVKAWSFVSWAALTGRVRIDLDLLAAKDLGGMSATVRQLWPQEYERMGEVARRLGWSYHWSRSVIDQFVPAVVAWSSTAIDQLGANHLDELEAELAEVIERVGHDPQAVARPTVRAPPAALRVRPGSRAAQARRRRHNHR